MHLGMDWSLLIGLVIFLVVGGVASFYLYVFIVRTKNEFRAAQPDLRIANLSAMNSGDVLTLYPELENVGRWRGVRLRDAPGRVGGEFRGQESVSSRPAL